MPFSEVFGIVEYMYTESELDNNRFPSLKQLAVVANVRNISQVESVCFHDNVMVLNLALKYDRCRFEDMQQYTIDRFDLRCMNRDHFHEIIGRLKTEKYAVEWSPSNKKLREIGLLYDEIYFADVKHMSSESVETAFLSMGGVNCVIRIPNRF